MQAARGHGSNFESHGLWVRILSLRVQVPKERGFKFEMLETESFLVPGNLAPLRLWASKWNYIYTLRVQVSNDHILAPILYYILAAIIPKTQVPNYWVLGPVGIGTTASPAVQACIHAVARSFKTRTMS